MNEIERDFRTQSQHLLWSVWRGLLVGVTAGAVVSLFSLVNCQRGRIFCSYLRRRPSKSTSDSGNCTC